MVSHNTQWPCTSARRQWETRPRADLHAHNVEQSRIATSRTSRDDSRWAAFAGDARKRRANEQQQRSHVVGSENRRSRQSRWARSGRRRNGGWRRWGKTSYCARSGVGKTSLVLRYIGKLFSNTVSPTIGASFFTFKLYEYIRCAHTPWVLWVLLIVRTVENHRVKLQLWDTAGQERSVHTTLIYVGNYLFFRLDSGLW